DEPTPCGALGAACANRSGAPASFDIWFRRQGWMFDWGALRWCEAYTTAPNGCYDAEAIALHEFGHAEVLDHHDLLADQSDYRDSVMNPIARSKPQPYYATRSYARCDLATLQRKYDVPDWAASIALCQSLDTYLTFAANDLSTGYRDPVTFTAVLRITDLDAYGRLGYNPLAQRSVTLQRRVPGSTTWQFVTHMAGLSSGIGYASTQAPSTTYEWRAVFLAPDDEGLQGATSPTVRVTVGSCSGSGCPQVVGND
ncbi:MAG: hypothetical protein H0W07_02475, partial [Chloroflexi bacterium]|nr:hypothetical protein [Chloroflexota bacterium]